MMKIYLFISLFLLSIFEHLVIGQESGEKHFYVATSQEIRTTYFDEVNDNIDIIERKIEDSNAPEAIGTIIGVVIGQLVPVLVKKAGLLAYNPKNYISEYGSSYSFKLNALRNSSAIDKINFTRTGIKDKVSNTITRFEFDVIHDLKSDDGLLNGYSAIALESFQFKFTKVKLKNSGYKTNIVAQVILVYYDLNNEKQELKLQPYKLAGVIPEGANAELVSIIPAKKNYQIIPPMKFIETVSVGITEVNDRKKDWDKYLEFFNSQNKNISSFLIDQLK